MVQPPKYNNYLNILFSWRVLDAWMWLRPVPTHLHWYWGSRPGGYWLLWEGL